jgi:hypothetical protein
MRKEEKSKILSNIQKEIKRGAEKNQKYNSKHSKTIQNNSKQFKTKQIKIK